jgi:hypothetical protein
MEPTTAPTIAPTIAPMSSVAPSGAATAVSPSPGPDRIDAELERFPVLDEVPELAEVLDAALRIDRLVARLIDGLMRLRRHGLAERATGVALEQWLAIVARRTGADRRMLLTTCEVFERLPSLAAAFLHDGSVSWAQTRAVVLRVQRLPGALDDAIDGELAKAIVGGLGADPDALVHRVGRVVASFEPGEQAAMQRYAEEREFLAIQPRLDGSGGRVFGDFGPVGLATLDAALSTPPEPGEGPTREGFAEEADPRRRRDVAASAGHRRARRLLELCESSGHAPPAEEADAADADGSAAAGSAAAGPGPARTPARPPQLLLRTHLSTLLDRDQTPATLLTTLTGGGMWVDAATARRLVEERGADLRTVVLDDTGGVVGVGRRRRVPPGWLRETLLALHDTCAAPGCTTAARVCDADHAIPWRPSSPGGGSAARTDVDQLAPLCRTDNRTKEHDGWQAGQTADGTRTWHHPRPASPPAPVGHVAAAPAAAVKRGRATACPISPSGRAPGPSPGRPPRAAGRPRRRARSRRRRAPRVGPATAAVARSPRGPRSEDR